MTLNKLLSASIMMIRKPLIINQTASIIRWTLSHHKPTKEFRQYKFINCVKWKQIPPPQSHSVVLTVEPLVVVFFLHWWCPSGVGGRCQSWRGLIISRGLLWHACSGCVLLGFRWAVSLLICQLQPVRGETPNTGLLQPRKFHVHKTHGTNSDFSYFTIQNFP